MIFAQLQNLQVPEVLEAIHLDDLDEVLLEIQVAGVGGDAIGDVAQPPPRADHLAELVAAGADGRAGLSAHQPRHHQELEGQKQHKQRVGQGPVQSRTSHRLLLLRGGHRVQHS